MAIYRKIDCRISNDKKFRELSVEGKLAWYTILSRRDLAPIGAFKASFESLAIEQRGNEYLNEGLQKGLPKAFSEVFIQALNELLSKGLIKYDSESFLIYVPNFLKYNFPENPNVVKSWNSALDSLPECDLTNHVLAKSAEIILNSQRDSFIKALPKEFNEAYRKGFAKDLPKGFAKAFGKGMPKQEQEQEQDIYTHTEAKDEKTQLSEDFAGRVSLSSKPEPVDEELPILSTTEVVEVSEAPSSKPKKSKTNVTKPDDVSDDLWADFLAHRKQKKAIVSERVINTIRNEAKIAGWTLEEALDEVILRDWRGFKAEWVKDEWKDPNAKWITADDFYKDLEPVTYSDEAKAVLGEYVKKGMRAYNVSDIPEVPKETNK